MEKENFDKDIYRLLMFYKQLLQILESFFSGHILIVDDKLNIYYLKVCHKIEEILKKPVFEKLARYEWRPYKNLRTPDDVEAPGADWEIRGLQLCSNFLSTIEEIFISRGEKVLPLDEDDKELINQIQDYLKDYKNYKKNEETKWLQNMLSITKKSQKINDHSGLPHFDFHFIKDKEIKELLIKDWEEAKKAFQNGLYKSTIVLCGGVIEALLIYCLSLIQNEAKSSYYQKYLESKNKSAKPPEIEYWEMYQLIEIAKQHNILTSNTTKLSHIIRDFRNFIHLYAQKREQSTLNQSTASVVMNLLAIIYEDILKWHKKKENSNQNLQK